MTTRRNIRNSGSPLAPSIIIKIWNLSAPRRRFVRRFTFINSANALSRKVPTRQLPLSFYTLLCVSYNDVLYKGVFAAWQTEISRGIKSFYRDTSFSRKRNFVSNNRFTSCKRSCIRVCEYLVSVKSLYNFKNLLQRQMERQTSESYCKMRRICLSFLLPHLVRLYMGAVSCTKHIS